MIRFLTIILIIALALPAFSQITIPELSASATVTQHIGIDDITVKYSRPNVRNRKIFGGLVPYGKVWRTGANNCTRINFSANMEVNNMPIPAGEYSLFTIPGENEWTIILNKNTKQWGAFSYSSKEDVMRFTVKPLVLKDKVETFEIRFQNVINNSAQLQLLWENTLIEFPISEAIDDRIMASIKKTVIDSTPKVSQPYFQAASYYFDHNKDLAQAYAWVKKAINIDSAYFYFYLKAQIEAKQLNKKEAKQTAEKGITFGQKVQNLEYVKILQNFIKNL